MNNPAPSLHLPLGEASSALILGSGASLDHYPHLETLLATTREQGSLILGVNLITNILSPDLFDYIYTHHTLDRADYFQSQSSLYPYKYVLCRYHCFQYKDPTFTEEGGKIPAATTPCYVLTPSPDVPISTNLTLLPEHFDATHPHTFTGANSILGAIGICLKMQVKTIMLLGCDNGSAHPSKPNARGYYPPLSGSSRDQQIGHSIRSAQTLVELQGLLGKRGINLLTLSPYIGSVNPLLP
jgi:hypothetical protein